MLSTRNPQNAVTQSVTGILVSTRCYPSYTETVFNCRSDKYSIARRDESSNWFIAYDVLVASMNINHLLTVTHNIDRGKMFGIVQY